MRHWGEEGKASGAGSWRRRAAVAVGSGEFVEAMAVLREALLEDGVRITALM